MLLPSSHLAACWNCARTDGQWAPLHQLAGPSVLPPVQTVEGSIICEQSLSSPSLLQSPFQLWPAHPEHSMCIRLVVYIQTLKWRPATIFWLLKGKGRSVDLPFLPPDIYLFHTPREPEIMAPGSACGGAAPGILPAPGYLRLSKAAHL